MRVLVVAAHPDDEVLGCGATIARLAQEGHEVYIAILGEGITSRYENELDVDLDILKKINSTAIRVGEMLGAKKTLTYHLPDNRFDTVPLLNIVKIVENLLNETQPEVVYTHHGGDLNIDHGNVHRAVLTATRPIQGHSVRELYTFEIPSSTEWAFGSITKAFQANYFVNIEKTLDLKLKALSLYEGELRAFPHPRSLDALRSIARRWGSVVGFEAAEAFELVRALR